MTGGIKLNMKITTNNNWLVKNDKVTPTSKADITCRDKTLANIWWNIRFWKGMLHYPSRERKIEPKYHQFKKYLEPQSLWNTSDTKNNPDVIYWSWW